ncbi:hypothetical protein ISS30_08645 [bacterium]|nr:hypothetical protein [FCB group bacterium]MBL7191751.1 hypothetical protein [bacterium]
MEDKTAIIEEIPLYTKVDVIQSLYPLKLNSPIYFTLEEYSDGVIAQNSETESCASAETEFEAVEGLRNEIIALYRDLKNMPDEELGKKPLRWKKFLCSIISE